MLDGSLFYKIPADINAEQAVIGSMLIDEKCIQTVLQKIEPDDFYNEVNQEIIQTIITMHDTGQRVDPVTVLNRLQCEKITNDEAAAYIRDLMLITPSALNAAAYTQIVCDKSVQRKQQLSALKAIELTSGNGDSNQTQIEIQEALQEVLDVSGTRKAESIRLCNAAISFYKELSDRSKSKKDLRGLKTGFDEIDALVGGWNPGNLIIEAARSGMGKSALALIFAVCAAKKNQCSVLMFSLEMTAMELCERVFANYADIPLQRIRDGKIENPDWVKLSSTASTVSQYDVRIVEDPSLDMNDITRLCRREKPSMVIIDHLGLIKPSGKYRDRREAVDLISRSLKQLAKELNIPVLCVAQLNRQLINRANKDPLLSDLRESGAIEQDADVVLLLHRPNYYDKTADKAKAYLSVAKNRSGKTGSVPLQWYGSRQRFTEDWTAIADNEISKACDQYYQEVLP